MDPVQVLISQGYPPEVARKMVESGAYDKMTNQMPVLPNLVGTGGTPVGDPNATDVAIGATTSTGDGAGSPDLQPYLDQGYNAEEAAQLAASTNYSLDQPDKPEDLALTKLQTAEGPVTNQQGDSGQLFGDILATAGSGISMEQAAYGLGQSIGAEKGTAKTLGIIGNAGKLGLSLARNIGSGLGQMKRSQYMQDYYDETVRKAKKGQLHTSPSNRGCELLRRTILWRRWRYPWKNTTT